MTQTRVFALEEVHRAPHGEDDGAAQSCRFCDGDLWNGSVPSWSVVVECDVGVYIRH